MQALWAYVLSKMRPDRAKSAYYVDLNPRLLKDTIGKVTEEEVGRAIERFCSQEKESASPTEGGKKLVREGQFLYRVVNAAEYQKLRNLEHRRAYQREYMQRRRAKRGPLLPGEALAMRAGGEEGIDQVVTEALPERLRREPPDDFEEPPIESGEP